jgi:hypothetical protein
MRLTSGWLCYHDCVGAALPTGGDVGSLRTRIEPYACAGRYADALLVKSVCP